MYENQMPNLFYVSNVAWKTFGHFMFCIKILPVKNFERENIFKIRQFSLCSLEGPHVCNNCASGCCNTEL